MNKVKHIVYCSYDGLLDPLGGSQILPYILEINKNNNYVFTIISFEKKSFKLSTNETYKKLLSVNINWIPLRYTKKPAILSTMWDIIKLKFHLMNKNIDLIHCRSYITSIVGLNLKKKKNIPFIFDMRGFWADERIDGGLWNVNKYFYKKIFNFFKMKEKKILNHADYTISLTENAKKEIQNWNLKNQPLIKVIPCCADGQLFDEKNIKSKREELKIKNEEFVLSYLGSIGTWYMTDEMLDFFKILNEKMPNSKFLFITKDNPKLIYDKSSQKGIPKEKLIIKSSTRELLPSYIGVSNFCIFFILPVFSKIASSPTKMGEIMNLGIPIICNQGIGDVDKIMEECMPELLIKSFEKKNYERVIELILNGYKPEKDKIKNTSKKYYSLNKGVINYKYVYKEILKI